MLLRSSSTPLLGSLLPSSSSCSTPHFHESPNHHHHHHKENAPSLSSPSFLHGLSQNQEKYPSIRRACSDGNLHSLLSSPHHHHRANPVLDPIPSFSTFNSKGANEYYNKDYDDDDDEEAGIGRGIGGGVSFVGHDQNLNLVENSVGGLKKSAASPDQFLAGGLGIDRLGSGFTSARGTNGRGGGSGRGGDVTGSGRERSDVENYYKRMVVEDPSNALFLRNYAQFLYQPCSCSICQFLMGNRR